MTTPTGPLLPDTLVHGRYRVVREIGRGGMGAVYEAVDTRLESTVALKQTLVRGARLDDAFAREARLLSSLRHPALPVVSDYFAEGESHFLVMQFIPGSDLASLIRQRTAPFSFGEVLPWADALLDALDYLHTKQPPIVHRDIKPQNLKLTPRGEIVLLDFGLAKGGGAADTTQSAGASLYGYTPQFAPLEQIKGTGTGPASDLYSLGATLYALLTNAPPPNALERASAVLNGDPDPLSPLSELNPQVPRAVADLVARAMALNPADRPRDAAAMRAELAAAVRTGSAGASTAGMATVVQNAPTQAAATIQPRIPTPPQSQGPIAHSPPPSGTGRSPWLIIAVLGLLGLLLIATFAAFLFAFSGSPSTSAAPTPLAPVPATPAAPILPPTADPREQDPAPTPIAQFPTIAIPDVNATVQAQLATVQAGLPTGMTLPLVTPEAGQSPVLLEFGEEGTGDGFLSDPRGVAIGPDGAIYVSDYSDGRVQRFSAEGRFERSWRVADSRPILALAAGRQGHVYVSQTSGVSIYDGATGDLLGTFAEGNGFDELIVLGDGNLLAIPWAGDELVRLSPEGNELERLPNLLEAAGSADSPAAIAADGLGMLYIMGDQGGEVFIFSPEGQFRDKFPAPGADFFPQIALDGQGRIYTPVFMGGILVFENDGRPAGSIAVTGFPFALSFDTDNHLYAVTNTPRVFKLGVGTP